MTEFHDYSLPEKGARDWHIPLNDNFKKLDQDIEIRDKEANLSNYTPRENALFRAIDTGTVYSAAGGSWELLNPPQAKGPVIRTRSELVDGLHDAGYVTLGSDITLDGLSPSNIDLGSENLFVDLNGHTLKRSAESATYLLDVTTTGTVVVCNGVIDGNRRGQSYSKSDSYHEITVDNASTLVANNLHVVDNCGFALRAGQCGRVSVTNVVIESGAQGLGSTAKGLDGIHTYDTGHLLVSNVNLATGDDAISITARDDTVEHVTVSGAVISTPENGSGVKLHVHRDAGSDVSIGEVDIDANVTDAGYTGVHLLNDSSNGNGVDRLSVGGNYTSPGDSGIKADMPVADFRFSGTVSGAGLHGLELQNGGGDCHITGLVEGSSRTGILVDGMTDLRIDATVDDNGSHGCCIKNSQNVTLSGVFAGNGGCGIYGVATTHGLLTGCALHGNAMRPVNTTKGSDYWTVVGNGGHSNGTAAPSLDGSNNVRANNNFR